MTTTVPPYTFGGITRPALILDDTGHIVLFGAAADFAATYGLKALYAGLPANTPYPPVTDSLSTPTDSNAGANSVAEGAPANTAVGITASASSAIGTVSYSLVGDNSGGGFKINATTGVVTVNDPTKIDFESAPGHAYTINVQATDGIITSTHAFTINVTDVAPSTPTDTNAGANTVTEGAAAGTAVGITAHSTDINGGAVTYSLTGDTSGGGFKVDANTGVVTVNDASKIDFESTAPGHTYTVTVQASDGTLTSSQTFTIGVTDVPLPAPIDVDATANSVAEGATAGTHVGITASANDPNGPTTHYSLIGDTSGGGFTIDTNTGVVTVADPTKIDFESTAPGHTYSITVQANDGVATTSQSFNIAVSDVAPSAPVDTDASGNSVSEGAAAGTTVGVTAHSTDINGGAVVYSLTGDTSGGGFTINAATGVVTVADPTKIDFESSGAGHSYTETVTASDGTLSSSQTFTIGVTDVAPSTPVDSDASPDAVVEGASAGTTVGITAHSTDVNGPAVTYSLVGDTSGGGFTINASTGVVTVADPTKIDFESSGAGHSYTIIAQASDGTDVSSQTFTIGVTDAPPSVPVDSDATANSVVEGAAAGTTVGVTAHATDVNGPAVTYSLTGDTSGGGFTINATTGVITVADPTKIDFESSGAGHSYTETVTASDGTQTSSQTFTIGVTDAPPSTPVDADAAANTVIEGAANGSTVGITASSTDVNGPAVTYSLIGDTSGGGFTINAATGVVTVADSTKIDFESSGASHSYTVTAQASDGTDTSSQSFTIGVTDAAPSTPVDSDATADSVVEGAAAGTTVGVTVSSTDVNGPPVTYSLTGDTSGGGFTINATTGVVTVADPTKIDFESSGAGHSYTVIAQASDGTDVSTQTFTIGVTDAPPSTPVDADATTNSVIEGAAGGTAVGVTASSTDVNGPAVTYSLTGDTSGGGFTINATTGVVTVADPTKIDFESTAPSHTYTETVTASDGTQTSSQTFTINVTDAPPTTPVDSDGTINQISQNAPNGTYTGLTASSTDVNGPAVTYSLVGDTSGGGFTINAATGAVTVADSTKVPFNAGHPSFDVTVQSSDGTDTSQQTFTINVIQNTPPVANDDSLAATEAGGANNSVPGSNPSGNVILATGSAGAVQDTDAQDASNALIVVAVHTGPEGASTGTGTVGQDLIGSHGTLHLNSDGSYTYAVNQTDAQVQALHTSAETITDVFNYTIQDTGGLQDTASITFTIHGADDLPVAVADTGTMTEDDAPTSFNVIANDSQDPDHTASNTITLGPGSITVTGPAGETMVNGDATASIVANQVQVTLNNAHFQQLRAGETATVTVPYTLTGDVGETSSANLVVTVNGVNDVPVAVDDSGTMTEDQSGHAFTVLSNDTLDPDHTAPNNVTVGSVTNLSAPSGEGITTSDVAVSVNGSNQVVVNLGSNFQHMQDGQTTTFDVAYTLHGDQPGDTSTAELHVTVTGVNDAPVAGNFTFNGVNSATGNTDLVVNDPTDGAPDPAGPQKTITASLLSGASDVDGPGPLIVVAGNIATAHGGSVTMQSDGDFIYKPPVGYTGSDSFTYQVSDQNAGASGVGLGTGTVTINDIAPKVWYVNADAATDGDGSSENPFNNLSHFNGAGGVDGTGDTIFLETASNHYTAPAGGLQLENNEQLISQSAGLVVPDGGGTGGTVTLVSASGANVVVDGGVLLGSGNNIQGVNFGTSSTFAISGTNVGTLHVDDGTNGTINNTSGGAVSITGSGNAVTMDFTSLTSSAGTNGIVINGASGTFHAHGGTISGASGADVSLASGTLDFTDDGAISDSTGTVVSISSMTAGTQSFTGTIGTTGSTDGSISLSSNTGSTIDFSGGMALSTGTSNAFSASGGGTINVTGTNHLTTTTGTALTVTGTTIGTSGLTFHDISVNGASTGINLNNTGTNAGLTVTGDGSTAGSGGTIQNTGQGATLTNTKGLSLSYMNFTNPNSTEGTVNNADDSTFNSGATAGINLNTVNGATLDHLNVSSNGTSGGVQTGINGISVSNFTLSNSSVVGFGDEVQEGDVRMLDTSGTANITNDTFGFVPGDTSAGENLVDMRNDSGTLTLNVTGSTFHNNADSTNGADGLAVTSVLNSTINLNVSHSTFTNLKTAGIDTFARDTSTMNVNITDGGTAGNGNTFTPGTVAMRAVGLNAEDTAHLNFNINRNPTMSGYGGPIVEIFGINSAVINGHVDGNTIANVGTTNRAGSPLDFDIEDNATAAIEASSNTINNAGQDAGIVAFAEGDGGTTNNKAALDLTLASNTINLTGNNLNANQFNDGILLVPGANANDATTMVANVHDNAVTGVTVGDGNVAFVVENSGGAGSHLYLENFNTNTNTTWNSNGNTPVNSTLELNSPASAAIPAGHNGGHTILPSNPNALFSGSGGVAALNPTAGETNLTQTELNKAVAAAIANWTAAGLSPDKIAVLEHTTYDVADITPGWLGQSTPGHVTVDVNADGHGWYIDPTPSDNSEFGIAVSNTTLLTDSTTAAAGHIDLVTTLEHEMGEQLGLSDQFAPEANGTLMSAFLVNGERALPSSTDVAQANTSLVVAPWMDHLSEGAGSAGGGDNFNFASPAATIGGGAVLDAIKGILDHVGPGVFDHLQDAFPWLNTAGETILHDLPPPVGTTLVNLFANGFDWPAQQTTPAPEIHTAVVDTTLHEAVGSILPDLHVLAATVPSIGGYLVH